MNIKICEQRQRILDETGHILVIGGPGSGKTTIALKKALLKLEGDATTNDVLFLSFSRAAVARILDSAKEWIPKQLLSRIDVQTFHSFFWGIIKTHSYLLGYPRKLSILLPHDEAAINKGIQVSDENEWSQWLLERERLFLQDGKIPFDLFSSTVVRLMSGARDIKKLVSLKYPLIIIDESQDSDEQQWQFVKLMAEYSQVLCLADLEQQIFDFRPGVSSERVNEIQTNLTPLFIDLGTQNNRSPDSEILDFGNDLLRGFAKNNPYNGISRISYQERADMRDRSIRQSIGILKRMVKNSTGKNPDSIAILASSNRGVAVIIKALRGNEDNRYISHKVAFDETKALLSSRLVAFLLEPKDQKNIHQEKAEFLRLLSDISLSNGSVGARKDALTWLKYRDSLIDNGKCRNIPLISAISKVFENINQEAFEGIPSKDWLKVRHLLRESGDVRLKHVEYSVQYLMAFNRGKAISNSLSDLWQSYGAYVNARKAIDSALIQEQLLSDDNDIRGLHVMTMHKSKGKQFDGVIIFHEENIAPLTSYRDEEPYLKSKKLLRVSVTRASKQVLFLTGAITPPAILSNYRF